MGSTAVDRAPAEPQSPPASDLPPLTGAALVVGTLAVSAAVFMVILDTSIANVSIPAISGNLAVSTSQGTWVITSFAVSNAVALPLTGWLTRRFGAVRLFSLATLLFVIGSWMCGLATSIESLIAFRVLQGAVAGPLIPLSQALLLSSYPRQKAAFALALWSMTAVVAPVAGPLLGGWITDQFSWPWIFYINVPVGMLSLYLTWGIYRHRETPTAKVPVDRVGLLLLALWVGSLQIMLDKGKELDWFGSGVIVALAIVAAVGLVVFLIWELTDEHPVVDLSLFARRNFATGVVVLSVGYGVFFANIVILPLWLQTQMGYTATDAGYVLAPVGFLAILLSPVVGKYTGRVDARLIASGGFLLFAFVSYLRSRFNTQADMLTLIVPTILQGAAVALFFVPLTTITLAGLPQRRIPSASGLANFARITAGAFGTSIATTVWDDRATVHHAQLVERLSAASPAVTGPLSQWQSSGMETSQALALLDRLVNAQAYMLSADDIYWASTVIFLLMVPLVWIAKPQAGHVQDAGGAH